jgi:hypothetical protein
MNRKNFFLPVTALLALVFAFVPSAGGGILGALALPFVAAGRVLRAMSLSGGIGNIAGDFAHNTAAGGQHRYRQQQAKQYRNNSFHRGILLKGGMFRNYRIKASGCQSDGTGDW